MQIRPKHKQGERGNILLVTLLTTLVTGFGLASYLVMVSSQNYSVMRSLAWNSALPVMEAGVEEALSHLQKSGLHNLSNDGWHYTSSEFGAVYYKKRFIGDAYFESYILPSDPPVIFAKGYALAPLSPVAQTGMILANLVGDDADEVRPTYLKRTVLVNTKKDKLFAKAMVAKGTIDLNGNNIATDSFDSRSELTSTNHRYDPAKASDHGDVATNSGLVNSLNVGSAEVKGSVATGPGGSVDIGPQGAVGDAKWIEGNNKGIQPGHFSDDMNVSFPEVMVPWTDSTPMAGTINGTNYNYVLSSAGTTRRYRVSDLKGLVYVAPNSDVILYVTDSVSLSGNDYILISPGATLKLVVGAASADVGGKGVVNTDGNALAFQYYGLPSNTNLALGGNASFTGVIYAPQAEFALNGGGKDVYDFVGASITKTVKMNGGFHFHYDEALAEIGPDRGFIVTDWNEI